MTLISGVLFPPIGLFIVGAMVDLLNQGGGDMSGPAKMMALVLSPFGCIAGLISAIIVLGLSGNSADKN